MFVFHTDLKLVNKRGKTAFQMASDETRAYLEEYMAEMARRERGEITLTYREVRPLGKYFSTIGDAVFPAERVPVDPGPTTAVSKEPVRKV